MSYSTELFDCDKCRRRGWRGLGAKLSNGEDMPCLSSDAGEAWTDVQMNRHAQDMADIFTAQRLRICPRLLVSAWSLYVRKAQTWFETGQLGMTFATAPPWISDAFGILTSERSRADKFRRENGGK